MSVQIESDDLKEGLLGLVVGLAEIIIDVLQKQALHRMESGSLSGEEVERLGIAFLNLDETIERIKKEHGLEQASDKIRAELDGLVGNAIDKLVLKHENGG